MFSRGVALRLAGLLRRYFLLRLFLLKQYGLAGVLNQNKILRKQYGLAGLFRPDFRLRLFLLKQYGLAGWFNKEL